MSPRRSADRDAARVVARPWTARPTARARSVNGYFLDAESAQLELRLVDVLAVDDLELVARSYERGRALSAATVYEIDDVIDPAGTRRWIGTALRQAPRRERRIPLDTW